jgi:hypothetical protein
MAMSSNRLKRLAGVSLFLVVTACWVLGLVAAEQDWITWHDFVLLVVTILSAVSVVLTATSAGSWTPFGSDGFRAP